MNAALQYGARPGDIKDRGGSEYQQAMALAKSMGIDVAQFGEKASEYWKQLDEMHTSDPDAYQRHMEAQVLEAKRDQVSWCTLLSALTHKGSCTPLQPRPVCSALT
jgi:hypothetical protein